MSCRCRDIRKCRKDINRLNSMISILSSAYSDDRSAITGFAGLAGDNRISHNPYNIADTAETELKSNETCTNLRSNIYNACVREKRNLNSELRDMRDEDYDYHNDDD